MLSSCFLLICELCGVISIRKEHEKDFHYRLGTYTCFHSFSSHWHWTAHRRTLGSHEVWHDWAATHILSCLLFTAFVIAHVKTHWAWYKSLLRNGLGKKSRVTVIVSVLFVLVFLTGCVLLGVEGPGSGIGLWHYRVGLLSIVLFGGHIIKRIPVLRKFAN